MFKTKKQQGLSQPVVVAILMLVALAVVILIWLLSLDVTYQTQETQDQAYEILTGEKPAKPSTGAIEGAYPGGNFGSGTAIGGGGIINPGLIPTPGPESTPTPTPAPGGGSGGNENPGGNPGSGSGSGDTPEEPQPTTFAITYDYDGGTVLKHAYIENSGYGYDYYDPAGYIYYTSVLPNKESLEYYYESEFVIYDVYTPQNSKATWHEDGKNASITTPRGNIATIIYEPTINYPIPGVYVLYSSQYAHSNYFKYLYGAENPKEYSVDTDNFKLLNPTKDGYIFKGWIGSNGNTPQEDVVIFKGTRGNLSYKAIWEPIENGTTAFAVYSSDDESLRFYNEENVPAVGSTFKGRKVDAVYLDVIFGESNKYTDTPNPYYIQPAWSEHADSIKKVIFDDGVIPVNTDSWFEDFTALEEVNLPEGLLYIGKNMFYGCSSLQQISLPDSLQVISYRAFCGCSSLESVAIPPQIKHIDMYTFSGCTSLSDVKLHDNIDMIGDGAFNSTALKSFTAPLNLHYLGKDAFEYCKNLETVKLNDKLVYIGQYAFSDCTLTEITLPKSLKMIGFGVFDDMETTLTNIYYDGTKAEWLKVGRALHGSSTGSLIYYSQYRLPIQCIDGNACDVHSFTMSDEKISINQFEHRSIATCEVCGVSGLIEEEYNTYHTPESWPEGPEDLEPVTYEGIYYHTWETKCTECNYEGLYYEPCWFEPVYDGEYVGFDGNGHVLKGLCACGAVGTYGENHTYEILPGTPAQYSDNFYHRLETVCACGAKSTESERHIIEDGACVKCGFVMTYIESAAPYANGLNYQIVGTWDYSDAKAVTIEVEYSSERDYDWYSIVKGTDYRPGGTDCYNDFEYISKNGEIVTTFGTDTAVRLSGGGRVLVENCDFLTGTIIIKTNGSYNTDYWRIRACIIPIYD